MEEKLKSIIALAVKMREAQKEYFKTRDIGVLKLSKALERRFDNEAQKLQSPSESPEPNLFDQ